MKILSIFIIVFLSVSLNLFSTSHSGGGSGGSGYCCEAKATFGGSCNVPSSCYNCSCKGGTFTATCECLDSGPGTLRIVPNISTTLRNDAIDFVAYCAQYGSTGMTTLSVKVQDVIDAVDNNNQSDYNSAEDAYVNAFFTLSTTEVNDIRTWVVNKGYPGF
jgi:hypothetical protein